jgi:hypothetical protein
MKNARKNPAPQANRLGKKMTLRSHVKNRKKILQFSTIVEKIH